MKHTHKNLGYRLSHVESYATNSIGHCIGFQLYSTGAFQHHSHRESSAEAKSKSESSQNSTNLNPPSPEDIHSVWPTQEYPSDFSSQLSNRSLHPMGSHSERPTEEFVKAHSLQHQKYVFSLHGQAKCRAHWRMNLQISIFRLAPHGQPFSLVNLRIYKRPCSAAGNHAYSSHGQPFCGAHLRIENNAILHCFRASRFIPWRTTILSDPHENIQLATSCCSLASPFIPWTAKMSGPLEYLQVAIPSVQLLYKSLHPMDNRFVWPIEEYPDCHTLQQSHTRNHSTGSRPALPI